jgi:hypothetical protein
MTTAQTLFALVAGLTLVTFCGAKVVAQEWATTPRVDRAIGLLACLMCAGATITVYAVAAIEILSR